MRVKRFWWTIIVGLVGFVNLYLALLWSPPEATMGNLVRIMYFHVSSAWIAFFAFFVTFVFAVLYLIKKNLKFDRIAAASAEIGLLYTAFTLITGSLWARPIWNTWWTWDPRLTTTLILFFLYVGYLLLRGTITGFARRARVTGIFAIISFIDVPIIHLSVTWWRSIHPQVITEAGFNMPPAMVVALLFGFVAFLCIYLLLLSLRVTQEADKMRIFALRQSIRSLHDEGQDPVVGLGGQH